MRLNEEKLSSFFDKITPILKKHSDTLNDLATKREDDQFSSSKLSFKERRAIYLKNKEEGKI